MRQEIDNKNRAVQIAEEFESDLPEPAKKLRETNWAEVLKHTLSQLDKLWEKLCKDYDEPIGGICICWDDCAVNTDEENTGWFVMLVEGDTNVKELSKRGGFEGGEKAVSVKQKLESILPYAAREGRGWDLLMQIIDKVLMPLMKDALKNSAEGKAFKKIKKASRLHVFTARYHDEKCEHLLTIASSVKAKKAPLTFTPENFVTKFCKKYNDWPLVKAIQNQSWSNVDQDNAGFQLGSLLYDHSFLNKVMSNEDRSKKIEAIALFLPNQPGEITDHHLASYIAVFFTEIDRFDDAIAHLKKVPMNAKANKLCHASNYGRFKKLYKHPEFPALRELWKREFAKADKDEISLGYDDFISYLKRSKLS